jgi:predicted transcriptional regulator
MNELLDLETRRKIYDLVSRNPGLHLSKIAEVLKMRISLAEYHLFYLEKNQVIISAKESGYTRYFVRGKIGIIDKKILSILRQDIPLRIILYLLKNENSKHKNILKNFNIAASTLSYHLKKLVKHNIISVQTYGEEKGYSIVDKVKIIGILVQYKPYSLIEGFKDVWLDLNVD